MEDSQNQVAGIPLGTEPPQTISYYKRSTIDKYWVSGNVKQYWSEAKGILEWGKDNHIRLYDTTPPSTAETLVFDVDVRQITKFSLAEGIIALRIQGRTYNVSLSFNSFMTSAVSGAVAAVPLGNDLFMRSVDAAIRTEGGNEAAKSEAMTDYSWWVDNLRRFNVRQGLGMSAKSSADTNKIALIVGLVGVPVLLIIIVIIAGLMGQY